MVVEAIQYNALLAMTGSYFWQEESFDHLVRNEREFDPELRDANEYRWSSAVHLWERVDMFFFGTA